MTHQASFDAFAEEREIRGEHPDPWEFDDYGPTMDEPAHYVAPQEYDMATVQGSGGIDKRELSGTGLAPSDFEIINGALSPKRAAELGYHPDDEHRPERWDDERERLEDLEGGKINEPAPESGQPSQDYAPDERLIWRYVCWKCDGLAFTNDEPTHPDVSPPEVDCPECGGRTQLQGIASVVTVEGDEDETDSARSTTRAVADGGEVVEESDEWGSYEPGDTVRLIEDVAVGLNTAPNILEAEISSSGKSVMIPEDADSIHGRRRLDAETIFAGESEFRDSTGYQLYTPGRYRNKQRSNYGPGPQAGANEVNDADNLPEPTHWPEGDDMADAPDECPECGAIGPWNDVGRPRCERCGVTVDPDAEEDEEKPDESGDDIEAPGYQDLERGDTLIIDGYRGEFVITRVRTMVGSDTTNYLEAARRTGGEWSEVVIQDGSPYDDRKLKINEDAEVSVGINVNDPDMAQDYEVTGNDMDRVRRYVRSKRGR